MSASHQANSSAQEAPQAAEPERYQGLLPGSYTDLKLVGQSKPNPPPKKLVFAPRTDQYTIAPCFRSSFAPDKQAFLHRTDT